MMYEPDDYITLWHTKGPTACGGRAFALKPYVLDTNARMQSADALHSPKPGSPIRCESCGGKMPLQPAMNVSVVKPKVDWEQHRWKVRGGGYGGPRQGAQ